MKQQRPGTRWLLSWRFVFAAIVTIMASSLVVPAIAQQATFTKWNVDSRFIYGISIDPSDKIWIQTGCVGDLYRLDPLTNERTTYVPSGVQQECKEPHADATGNVWSFGTITSIGSVISRLDPGTLQVTSWPTGVSTVILKNAITDPAGNVWYTGATSSTVARLNPETDTRTIWLMPFVVGEVGGVDSSGRLWFDYYDGTSAGAARLDPSTNAVIRWPVAPNTDDVLRPFVDTSGRVWFALARSSATDSIMRLDPATDMVTDWQCRPGCDGLNAVSVDGSGMVWYTDDLPASNTSSRIGRLDPNATPPIFTDWTYSCSDVVTGACGLNQDPAPRAVAVDSLGNVWTHSSADGFEIDYYLIRLDP